MESPRFESEPLRIPNMGTIKQAAALYGLSPVYIRRLCKLGKICYVNAGHLWLVNLDSLARYFEPRPGEGGVIECERTNWKRTCNRSLNTLPKRL